MTSKDNERYLFSWNEIPGPDSSRLIEFLKQDLCIDWAKKEQIKKDEKSERITISDGKKSISLKLNDDKTKINVIVDQCLIMDLPVKEENGNLNIYFECNIALIPVIIFKELMIRCYLNEAERNRSWKSWNPLSDRDAVKIKHLEIISGHLHKIHMFLARDAGADDGRKTATLCSILRQIDDLENISENCAWEIGDLLKIELIRVGDDAYLYELLQSQKMKMNREWESDRCRDLIDNYKEHNGCLENCNRHETRSFLEYLEQKQIEEYRYDRAKIKLRKTYLGRMAVILALLIILVLSPSYIAASQLYVQSDIYHESFLIVFVLASGALGSVLSRALKVGKRPLHAEPGSTNNELPLGIRLLKSEMSMLLSQLCIGAAAAFILFLILKTNIIKIYEQPISGIETFGVLTFLAGFSEPYFIS
ncbi:MAG TPA: hypothetical protein VN316_00405, partial [candidate division Zixibacteria bacterium]|nr:hypothetical protein [candidate division Zixibacteria bacterium]